MSNHKVCRRQLERVQGENVALKAEVEAWRGRFKALIDEDRPDMAGNVVIRLQSEVERLKRERGRAVSDTIGEALNSGTQGRRHGKTPLRVEDGTFLAAVEGRPRPGSAEAQLEEAQERIERLIQAGTAMWSSVALVAVEEDKVRAAVAIEDWRAAVRVWATLLGVGGKPAAAKEKP